MNKIKYLLTASTFFLFTPKTFANYPSKLPLLPVEWMLYLQAKGDINGDKRPDYALILQKNDANNRRKREDGYEEDFNPRRLVVYLSSEQGFQKALETQDGLLPSQNRQESCVTDPLEKDSLIIRKHQLWLKLEHFSSCGGWQMGNSVYQIRYKDNKFSIIGKETFLIDRATHDETHESTNYLTNKRRIRININFDDPERHNPKEIWEKLSAEYIPNTLDISQLTELF